MDFECDPCSSLACQGVLWVISVYQCLVSTVSTYVDVHWMWRMETKFGAGSHPRLMKGCVLISILATSSIHMTCLKKTDKLQVQTCKIHSTPFRVWRFHWCQSHWNVCGCKWCIVHVALWLLAIAFDGHNKIHLWYPKMKLWPLHLSSLVTIVILLPPDMS